MLGAGGATVRAGPPFGGCTCAIAAYAHTLVQHAAALPCFAQQGSRRTANLIGDTVAAGELASRHLFLVHRRRLELRCHSTAAGDNGRYNARHRSAAEPCVAASAPPESERCRRTESPSVCASGYASDRTAPTRIYGPPPLPQSKSAVRVYRQTLSNVV